MLRHLIEARKTTQARVAAEAGIAESTISAVLAGKRGLSRKHIEALARHFKVNPAVFISVPIVLGVVALLAIWIPARRASRVSPIEALRYE